VHMVQLLICWFFFFFSFPGDRFEKRR
jgi:hypothetical protein